MTSDGTNSLTWDRAGRLLEHNGVSNAYNGLGQRVQQTVSSVVTEYLLDVQPGLAVVLSETAQSQTKRFVHGPRGIHAFEDNAGDWAWMLRDGLGSVRGQADAGYDGQDWGVDVQATLEYTGYGKLLASEGTAGTNYGFTGEPTDANDLVYLRARYLNPELGVFPSLDPFEGVIQRAMSLNGYSWVEGNVPNAVDPSGEDAFPECIDLLNQHFNISLTNAQDRCDTNSMLYTPSYLVLRYPFLRETPDSRFTLDSVANAQRQAAINYAIEWSQVAEVMHF